MGLAQDQMLAKAGTGLAQADKWRHLGRADGVVWGVLPNGVRPPHQETVQYPDFILSGTCTVKRAPCRHALGLILLLHENEAAFTDSNVPDWATDTLGRVRQQHAKATTSAEFDIDPQRLALVKEGMDQLALWLRDMVRDGLATLPAKPKSYWQTMTARLTDAHAGDIASDLQQLATLPDSSTDWPDRVLRQIGRLYLLTQGYANYDTLSAEMQADLRMAVGWIPKRPSAASERVRDDWLVLGRQSKKINKIFLHRTWLWGRRTQRPALLLRMIRTSTVADSPLITGSLLDATLAFHPSNAPLAALLTDVHGVTVAQGDFAEPTGLSIEEAMARHGHYLAKNPWLRQFPFVIQANRLQQIDGRRWLLDPDQRALPLPKAFKFGWHLRAMSDGQPFLLFGEWRNEQLTPLSGWLNGRWFDLHILRGGRTTAAKRKRIL